MIINGNYLIYLDGWEQRLLLGGGGIVQDISEHIYGDTSKH